MSDVQDLVTVYASQPPQEEDVQQNNERGRNRGRRSDVGEVQEGWQGREKQEG